MISVPSPQLRLSGNKLLPLFGLVICSFLSCDTSKKAIKRDTRTKTQTTKVDKPKTTKPLVDTLVLDILDPSDYPPITADMGYPIEKKDRYNVVVFLPLDTDKFIDASVSDSRKGTRFINYYSGMLLALDQLEREGVKLNVKFYDTDSGNFDRKLKDYTVREADVIIGPYDRTQLKKTATFAKENQIVLISPWQSSTKITADNPFYVQLRPSIQDHYRKLLDFSLSRHNLENVFLLGREENSTDRRRLASLQNLASEEFLEFDQKITELYVPMDSLIQAEFAFDSLFITNPRSAIVIPNVSTKDERFVYNALRKISTEKGLSEVYVYGMPMILDSDKISFDYYRNLNVHAVRSKFVERQQYRVKQFKRTFYDRFEALPTDDAYDAYDMMNFVGRSLADYGKYFQFHLGKKSTNHLQTSYQIEGELSESANLENIGKPEYFVNRHLDVIRFDGKHFSRVN